MDLIHLTGIWNFRKAGNDAVGLRRLLLEREMFTSPSPLLHTLQRLRHVNLPVFAGLTLIAVVLTAAAALATAALFGIGTAYAGFTALFCFIQVKYNTAHNTQKNHNDYKILHADLHRYSFTLSQGIFRFQLPVSPYNKRCHNGHYECHSHKPGGSCSHI